MLRAFVVVVVVVARADLPTYRALFCGAILIVKRAAIAIAAAAAAAILLSSYIILLEFRLERIELLDHPSVSSISLEKSTLYWHG